MYKGYCRYCPQSFHNVIDLAQQKQIQEGIFFVPRNLAALSSSSVGKERENRSQSRNPTRMIKEGRYGGRQISLATEIGSCGFNPNLRNAIKLISYILDILEASISHVQEIKRECFIALFSNQQYSQIFIKFEKIFTEWHFVPHTPGQSP